MTHQTGSPLLQCLEKLNDDVWEQVLLPKLQQQGSAAAVALSCTQLRRLCQHSVDTLHLVEMPSSSTSAQQLACHAAALASHFPNCRTVYLSAHDETCYWQLPVVLPLLGRLTKLDTVGLELRGDDRPLPGAMLLGILRTALTGLQHLFLGLGSSQDWTEAPYCWEHLAEFTHLKTLSVECRQAEAPFSCEHLSVLGNLSTLEELVVHIPDPQAVLDVPASAAPQPEVPQLYGWLGSLSALTRLVMSLPTVSGLSTIGGCTSLCDLVLLGAVGPGPQLQLGQAEWDALGQLTKLTVLDAAMGFQAAAAVAEACNAALSRMGALVSVGGPLWTEDTLQILSQLPCLHHSRGCWGTHQLDNAAPLRARDPICAHVTALEVLGGDAPFRAFPNLLKISLWSHTTLLSLDALAALLQHNPKVQEMWVSHESLPSVRPFTLDNTTPVSQRIAAIKSLSRLEQLSVLGWKPSVDAEVAALVAAIEPLAKPKHVAMVLESGSQVSCVGLLHLARLAQVEKLQILWNDDTQLPDVAGATALLSMLCHVSFVEMLAAGPQVEFRMLGARGLCEQQGLPLPHDLNIMRLERH